MWSQDLFNKTYFFAASAHKNQFLPDTDLPYLTHITLVCMEALASLSMGENKFDANFILQTALLHDTLEDTEVTFEELEQKFGKKVATGVLALSKEKKLPKEKQLKDSIDRIKKQPKEIWIVKMADRITNLSEPPRNWSNEKRHHYFLDAQMIYENLKEAYPEIAARLFSKIEEYQRYFTTQ